MVPEVGLEPGIRLHGIRLHSTLALNPKEFPPPTPVNTPPDDGSHLRLGVIPANDRDLVSELQSNNGFFIDVLR